MAPGADRSTDGDGPRRLTDHLHFTFEDPLSSLPETAQNLLVAAKEIVADEGFEALTLKTVSERAGENKAMVSYYFDNKAGLIAAVLDSVIHDEYLASLRPHEGRRPGRAHPAAGRGDAAHGRVGRGLPGVLRAAAARAARRGAAPPDGACCTAGTGR